jgi:hypothetical protein
MTKNEVEKMIGKGDKGTEDFIEYNFGNSTWGLSYSKEKLIDIGFMSSDKSKRDSSFNIGYLYNWKFSQPNKQGHSNLEGFSIGGFEVVIDDSTIFVPPISGKKDLSLSTHVFRIVGPFYSNGNGLLMVARQIEDISLRAKIK